MSSNLGALPELSALDGYEPSQALGSNSLASASPVANGASLTNASPVASATQASTGFQKIGSAASSVGNALGSVGASLFGIDAQAITVIVGLILIAGGIFIFATQGIFAAATGELVGEGKSHAKKAIKEHVKKVAVEAAL